VENQFYNKWAPTFTLEQLGYVCLLYDRIFLFTLWRNVDLFYIRTCLFTLWQDVCVYPVIGCWFYSTSGCFCLLYDKMWTLPHYVASFPAPRQRPGNEDIPATSVSLQGGGYLRPNAATVPRLQTRNAVQHTIGNKPIFHRQNSSPKWCPY